MDRRDRSSRRSVAIDRREGPLQSVLGTTLRSVAAIRRAISRR